MRLWLLGCLGVAGVGCRLPSAPFFAVLWFVALGQETRTTWRRVGAGFASVVGPALMLLGPFYADDPENARFWTLGFHALSLPARAWRTNLEDVWGLAPLWWTTAAVLVGVALVRRRMPVSREVVVAVAALVACAANLAPRGVYAEYAVPFLLPLATALAGELHRTAAGWPATRRRVLIGGLAAAHLVSVPTLAMLTGRATAWDAPRSWLPPNVPDHDRDLAARLARARSIVEQLVPPSAPLYGPNIILAAETERAVLRDARMGPFAFSNEFSEEKARRLHLLSPAEWRARVANPEVKLLAFFTTPRANYAWSVPSFRVPPREEAESWLAILRRDFVIVQQDLHFLLMARAHARPR